VTAGEPQASQGRAGATVGASAASDDHDAFRSRHHPGVLCAVLDADTLVNIVTATNFGRLLKVGTVSGGRSWTSRNSRSASPFSPSERRP
jgi:hypothetical protein